MVTTMHIHQFNWLNMFQLLLTAATECNLTSYNLLVRLAKMVRRFTSITIKSQMFNNQFLGHQTN